VSHLCRRVAVTAVGPATVVALHPLVIRPSEDEPDTWVVGRPVGGEFVELPPVGVDAIRLLGTGLPVGAVEDQLADGEERPDVAELVTAFVDLGFVSTVDGSVVAAAGPVTHLPRLTRRHVGWLFGWPARLAWAGLALAATVAVVRDPGLLPGYRDFFWAPTVGLSVLLNTVAFAASAIVHELLHLAAARSLGVPARIGFSTRLTNLVLQTDVSAAWAVPRRQRYRIYLAGMAWDAATIFTALLLVAWADLPGSLDAFLTAFVLVVLLSMTVQVQVYMRTDLYFVLQDLLRCGDLFHDGLAYARWRGGRTVRRLLGRPDERPDPSADLPARERRAVRIYTPLLVLGATIALAVYAGYGIPILVETTVLAVTAVFAGDSLPAAIDGVLVLLVEGGLQVLFLVTFYRNRRAGFRRLFARLRPAWWRS
jgi:hypothetical protein